MTIFGDMTKRRKRLDDEQLSDAYADLAASVLGKRFRAGMDADEMALANDAIASILHWYGAKEAEVPDDLTDFNDRLAFLLRPTGIMHRDVRLTEGWYKDAVGAMLGRLEDNTPVALIPRAFSGYYYLDPNTEKKVVLNRRTAKGIQPDAICFYRPFPLRSLKTTDLGAFIASSLRLSDYAFALVATMAVTLIGLLPAQLNQLLFSVVIPSNSKSLILPMAMLLVSITLSQGLINSCKALVMSRLTTKLSVQVEAATMGRILSLEPDFFKHYPAGDLASRTVKMNNLVQAIIDLVLSSGLTSLFSLVYIFQIMAFAPGLVVPALLVIVADVAVTTLSAYLQMSYNKRELNAGAKVSGITTSLLQGIQKIKLAGAERRAFAQWGKAYAEQTRSSFDKPLFLKVSGTLSTVIGLLGTIVIYYFAAATNVSVANFMAFNTAYGMVVGAVKTLSATGTAIASIRPTMEHIEPILKAVPEVSESKRAITRVSGSISLVNVTFSYGEDLPPIFDGFSLKITPGEYIAITGRTGCGKSTLMRLLLGFEKPSRGAIYYDGIDTSTLDLRSLRRNIGVVLQDGKLFTGDIFSNITISAPWLTMDEAWDAAEKAGVAEDIRAMPMGMHTVISEGGGGISGGQKQRLLIARAIAPKPKVLILDEATSALDNVTQKHVSESLEALGSTRITVAHRLSTIRQCDRIVMLEGGRIAEDGTYDELIALKGHFADLVARQRLDS